MAYKVVKPNLTSCMAHIHENPVQYKVNKWVHPKTPLLVFKRLCDAVAFASRGRLVFNGDVAVWRCKTKELTCINRLLLLSMVKSHRMLFWKGSLDFSDYHYIRIPPGTYSTPAVMLTKRVR